MRIEQGVRTGLGHGGITCVLQTQFSSFLQEFKFIMSLKKWQRPSDANDIIGLLPQQLWNDLLLYLGTTWQNDIILPCSATLQTDILSTEASEFLKYFQVIKFRVIYVY